MEQKHNLINIGRQFGSGGRVVALKIGQELGIPVYDNELISKAAEESGFSKELFQKSDEKRSFFSLSTILGSGRWFELGRKNYMGDDELFAIQSDVIRKIAEKGPAIFIGRCSNYVLRDMRCLDVFITAPMEERIKRVAERAGISKEEAEICIEKADRGREAYYNFYSYGDWGAAKDYDLCVDSSLLGIDETAKMIISFGRKSGLLL